jgi:hypothetical protein
MKASRTLYDSQARTASPATVDQSDDQAVGLRVVINVTAIVSTPSVIFNIEGLDKTSGQYYILLASAAIVGTGMTVLHVHPTAPVTANLSAPNYLPDTWRVRPVHGNANSITYSVGAEVFSEVV